MNSQLAGAALIYMINIGMILPAASSPAAIFHAHEALPDARTQDQVHNLCLPHVHSGGDTGVLGILYICRMMLYGRVHVKGGHNACKEKKQP